MLSTYLCSWCVQVEALAKAQFAAHRDAYECTLLYIALGKTPALAILFKQVHPMVLLTVAYCLVVASNSRS
jgi:hypothetical protein